ncbi:serine/threonine-protein phosphatase 2A activator-like isoform X1 [Choristoneura fumiferana]|uniref:serine/threonine-protein phosphatase 2A activator-like isoform X1 n=2 Tax=Choristoneura fumiferana TaxID=7141 RepID=UPI003D15CBAE
MTFIVTFSQLKHCIQFDEIWNGKKLELHSRNSETTIRMNSESTIGDGKRSATHVSPVLPTNHRFLEPERAVKTITDMAVWEKSEAYMEYTGFIATINEAIKGKPLSVDCKVNDNVKKLLHVLEEIGKYIEEFPPVEQPQRFGNTAFREWLEKVKCNTTILLQGMLELPLQLAIPEIKVYLEESFGNATRIDYGTGHEMSFVMFLCCLYKIGFLIPEDNVSTVFLVFNKYLNIARTLQKTYRMEPAGSHGVWSLDDYQFIPFIWGSAQLVDQPKIYPPVKFLDDDIIDKYANDYMFLSCIKYIKDVKKGPFAEHSNQLWSISAVSSWSKINQGLIKMYKKEVLSKFPVVQHVLFGSLLPIRRFPINH